MCEWEFVNFDSFLSGFRRTLRDTMKRLRVSIDEPYRIAVKDFLNLVFSATPESDTYWVCLASVLCMFLLLC